MIRAPILISVLLAGFVGVCRAQTSTSENPFSSVSKERPFINSLGMRFVPSGTDHVLFSIWETRVRDFSQFVQQSGHDAERPSEFGDAPFTLEKAADQKGVDWIQKGGSWRDPRFPSGSQQTEDHPVVCVSPRDAEAFCLWLTQMERDGRLIPPGARYRLPTDDEWSRACGKNRYPWGTFFPPKSHDGNYSGTEAMIGEYTNFTDKLAKLRREDPFARTAPVGSFRPNAMGLHDMGGNVWEWCGTWYQAELNDSQILTALPLLKEDLDGEGYRVLRGGGWNDRTELAMRSDLRDRDTPLYRRDDCGFRCVLELPRP